MTNEIPNELIERALQLTGKSMEDMNRCIYCEMVLWAKKEFSIEKFFYYLLSKDFINKYKIKMNEWFHRLYYIQMFWTAIYDYSSWNSEPIISLLSKIWAK